MLKKRIVPTILLKGNRCVKGVNFTNFRDVGDPVTVARVYDAQKADELVFLDIEANSQRGTEEEQRNLLYDIIKETASECFMPLCVGGGIRTIEEIRKLFQSGADKVSLNTTAVENPELVREAARLFGSANILVSIDVKKTDKFEHEVFTHSGQKAAGLDAVEWAKKAEELGAGELLITSIDREGTRSGYDLALIRKITSIVQIPVVASGGVGSLKD
ncbi:MAG: imidazole glycerol phosphate synthase cyclase subunit, partial [Nanoarchaeota archaeon]